MSTISAGTTTTTAFKVTSDTTGSLLLKTGASGTTAIDIDAAQVVSIGNIAVTGGTINNTIIGGTTAAAGSFTTLTAASTVTFNGGTANGVAYLNGSKNLTTGSALTFDGTNLNVGGSGAGSRLVVRGTGTTSATFSIEGATSGGATRFLVADDGLCRWYGTSNSETMRLDNAGNLGIGTTSPSRRLEVASSTAALIRITSSGAQTGYAANEFYNFAGFAYCGTESSAAGTLFSGTTAYATVLGNTAAYPLQLATNNTVRATLDSSGNLGINTSSPSSFGKVAIQVEGTTTPTSGANVGPSSINLFAATNGSSTNGTTGIFGWNAAAAGIGSGIGFSRESSADWGTQIRFYTHPTTTTNIGDITERARITSGGDLLVGLTTGAKFSVSYGGNDTHFGLGANYDNYITAGSSGITIFRNTSTERARITSGGILLVGTTSTVVSGSERVGVIGTSGIGVRCTGGSSAFAGGFWNDATTGDNSILLFYTETGGTQRGSITYNRGAGQVSYNITSDARLKENIADSADAGGKIDAMRVRQFDWKETGNHLDYGFVAQELHNVASYAVSKPEDEEAMWSVDYSKLVPMLVKELQSVRARLAALESK